MGPLFGFSKSTSVCLANTCADSRQDGDETGVDCGGSCAPCSGGGITATRYGGANNDLVLGNAYDSAGNLYLAGRTSSASINFGSGALSGHGGSDIFLAKFDPTGKNLWSKLIGGTGNDGDAAVNVAVDSGNNVVLVGNFYTTVNFGGGNVTVNGTSDAFVAKYNSAGTFQWAKHYGGPRGNKATAVATDSAKEIYVTGAFQTSINLGGPTFTAASGNTAADMFILRLHPAGTYGWSKAFGSAGDDEGLSIAVDSTPNVYVAGLFSDSINFGTGAQTSAGSTDALAMQLNSAGTVKWVKTWGAISSDRANAVAWLPNGHAVFGGQFRNSVNFGDGAISAGGGANGFLVSLVTTDGSFAWKQTFTGTGSSQVLDLATNSTSKLAVVGSFQGSVDFGSGAKASAGANDVFAVFDTGTGTRQFEAEYGGTGGDLANTVATTTGVAAFAGQFSGSMTVAGSPLVSAGLVDAFVAKSAF